MNFFKIDPHSGLADSYLDIKFEISLDPAFQSEIEIFNQTTGQQLEILSVSAGYIQRGNKAIVHKNKKIEGFINLFNKDKMNSALRPYASIDLKCRVTSTDDNQTVVNEHLARFYNESMSLDAGVVPFDLIIENKVIDFENHIPLHLTLVSDSQRKYELCIMNENQDRKCVFEVAAERGNNDFSLPCEIIWHDCEVGQFGSAGLKIYWVKFEGIDHQRFRNRRYIPIDGTNISFKTKELVLKPQTRQGPTGVALGDDFVLSDRYFVHTWKSFTSFGNLPNMLDRQKQLYLTRFLHEYQRLAKTDKRFQTFAQTTEKSESVPLSRNLDRRPLNTLLASAFMPTYNSKSSMAMTKTFAVQQPSQTIQKGKAGCGCTRK